MNRPTPEHVAEVLAVERDLTDWLFTPCQDDTERAQLRHFLNALDRVRAGRIQTELPLERAA